MYMYMYLYMQRLCLDLLLWKYPACLVISRLPPLICAEVLTWASSGIGLEFCHIFSGISVGRDWLKQLTKSSLSTVALSMSEVASDARVQ